MANNQLFKTAGFCFTVILEKHDFSYGKRYREIKSERVLGKIRYADGTMSYKPIQSIQRCAEIIELVANSQHGTTLRELHAILGISTSTLHNILRTLVMCRFLRKTHHPIRYSLGTALVNLVRIQRHRFIVDRISPLLTDIAKRTQSATSLVEIIAGRVMSLLYCSPQKAQLKTDLLNMRPYGVGLLFLALLDERGQAEFLANNPFHPRDTTWRTWANVKRELAKIRRDRFLVIHRNCRDKTNIFRVAAPIYDVRGDIIAAVTLIKPVKETTRESQNICIQLVCQAAADLSYKQL